MYEVPDTHIAWVPLVVVLCGAEAGAIARLIAIRGGEEMTLQLQKASRHSWEYEQDES